MSKRAKLLLRLLISALLIGLLLWKVNISQLQEAFLRVGAVNFFLLSALYISSQIVSSFRWKLVIRALGYEIKVIELLKAYLLGMFANLFLPSIIGGDAIRAYLVAKRIGASHAISSIFLERYNGLVALMAIALFSVTVFHAYFSLKLRLAIACVSLFILLAVFLLRFKPFARFARIRAFYDDVMLFHSSFYLLPVTFLSFLVQLIVISVYALAGGILGLDVGFMYYLAFIPVINLISLLPISFNGIGVREFSFVYFFAFAGLDRVEALSLSLLVFFVVVFCSLLGGAIYLVSGKKAVREAEEFYKEQSIDS